MKTATQGSSPLARHFSALSLLRFALPSIGMMLVISLYTLTDGIFIGRYAGPTALAASNIVYPAVNLAWGIAIMLASGGSALVAKTLGEQKPRLARERFTLIAFVGLLAGSSLGLLLFLFFDEALQLLGATPELLPDARAYLGALLPFFPTTALLMIFNAFYIADGRPILGFLVALAAGATNAVLDYVFLAHLGLGVYGAGLATGLADTLEMSIGLWYFARLSRSFRFTRFHVEWRALWQTVSNGISEMVTQISIGVTTFLFNLITYAWAGENGVAAITVILYAELLMTSVLIGFSTGIAPIFSYHYGAKNNGELVRLVRLALLTLTGAGLLAFGAAQLLGAPLVALFLPGGGEVAALTLDGFSLFSLSFLLCGYNLFASGFFTAISDGRTSALLSFARNFAGIVISLLVLPHFLGLTGVWLAVPAADAVAVLLSAYCLLSEVRTLRRRQQAEPRSLVSQPT